jgi:hypothetical protein
MAVADLETTGDAPAGARHSAPTRHERSREETEGVAEKTLGGILREARQGSEKALRHERK